MPDPEELGVAPLESLALPSRVVAKQLAAPRDLGKGMVKLIKMGFKYPPELMGMSIAYGTHTK